MARLRKHHVQTELAFSPRGGKRKNAGRPKSGFRASERHKQRPRFERLTAVHVTLRLVERYGALRKRDTYYALRAATQAVLGRSDFRIVHISIENDHIHLIVEAECHQALWRGMQAFQISAAQHLNRALSKRTGKKRRGQVFADRYHERLIKSPTQARHTINYVLNNWRRHREDEGWDEQVRFWDVDYMSSAPSFEGWLELKDQALQHQISEEHRLCVARPQGWLLAEGWKRGGSISMYAVPGPGEDRFAR